MCDVSDSRIRGAAAESPRLRPSERRPQVQGALVRGCVCVLEQSLHVRLRLRDADVCDCLRVRETVWTSGGVSWPYVESACSTD